MELPENFIISVGKLEWPKGHWHLIRAFKNIINEWPDVKLVIIGRGSLYNNLIELISQLNLDNHVLLYNTYVPSSSVYSIIKKAKFTVLSSIHEGFPNILVESLALGKPIISTNCFYGPAEIMEKDYNYIGETDYRYLTPKLDGKFRTTEALTPEEKYLSNSIDNLLNKLEDINYSETVKKKAMKRAMDFDINNIIPKYVSLIEEVQKMDKKIRKTPSPNALR